MYHNPEERGQRSGAGQKRWRWSEVVRAWISLEDSHSRTTSLPGKTLPGRIAALIITDQPFSRASMSSQCWTEIVQHDPLKSVLRKAAQLTYQSQSNARALGEMQSTRGLPGPSYIQRDALPLGQSLT